MADVSKVEKKITSGLRLHAREVVVVVLALKVEKKTTSSSCLHAREVMVVAVTLKPPKRPPLARIWM